MKFLLYFLGFLLLLFIVFLLGGLFTSTVDYGHEIVVDKSAKEAWAVHQDASKFDQWLKGFKSIEHIGGEMGAVGSSYKVVVKPAPDQPEFVMTETITDMKDFESISFRFDSDMMEFNQTTTFVEAAGKTTIKTDSRVKGSNIIWHSLFSWMEMLGGSFQAQEAENIDNLKTVINNNTSDYYPPAAIDSTSLLDQ